MSYINLNELGYVMAGAESKAFDCDFVAALDAKGRVARANGICALTPVPKRAPKPHERMSVFAHLSQTAAKQAVEEGEI